MLILMGALGNSLGPCGRLRRPDSLGLVEPPNMWFPESLKESLLEMTCVTALEMQAYFVNPAISARLCKFCEIENQRYF